MKQVKYPFVMGFDTHILGILIFSAWAVALPVFADITVSSSRAWAESSATTSWYSGITQHDVETRRWTYDEPSGGGGGWSVQSGRSGVSDGTATGAGGAVVYLQRSIATDCQSARFELRGAGIASAVADGNPPHPNDSVADAGGSIRSCSVQFTLGRAATFHLKGGITAGKRSTGGTGAGGITLNGPSGQVARYYVSASGVFVGNEPTVTTLAPGSYTLQISGSGAATGQAGSSESGAGGASVTLDVEEIPASAQGDEGASSPTLLTSSTNVQEFTDVNEAFATWFPVESGTVDLQVTGGSPTLTFPVRSGMSYAIDWSDDLNIWHRKEIRLAQEGEVQEVFNDLSVDEFTTRRFYKITPYLPSMPGDDDLIEP